MSPQFREDSRVLVLNGGHERLAAAAPSYILRGTTAHFAVNYDQALGANGPVLADAVLGSCEADYARLQALFGNISIGSLPFTVYVEVGTFGAYHASCPATGLTCAAFTGNDSDLIKFLVAVEASEVLMADQQRGWNCGASAGEALSRVIGAEFYPDESAGSQRRREWGINAKISREGTFALADLLLPGGVSTESSPIARTEIGT